MNQKIQDIEKLSPWWRNAVVIVMIVGFSILIGLTVGAYRDAPPIPVQVVDPSGRVVYTGDDIRGGQQIFIKYGLMENGTIWGHGAYLGPDFSAAYLHAVGLTAADAAAKARYGQSYSGLDSAGQSAVQAEVASLLKQNNYDSKSGILTFSQPEADAFTAQQTTWAEYFAHPSGNAGLEADLIHEPEEIRQLTAFFSWAAWASVADRPGQDYSYTNNFPYDPLVGNKATANAVLWSALSLIALLGGTAAVLFAFGRFNFLGWKGKKEHIHPQMLPGSETTASQRGTIKFFVVVALLMLAQGLAGALIAHYRADPGSFYGLDLSGLLPSNITRTGHLQTAIFWIATAYIAGALFLAPSIGGKEPRKQSPWVNVLFGALVIVVGGSLLGNMQASTTGSGSCGSGWETRVGNSWTWGESGRCFWRLACCSG